jgi:hypothetical protein
MEPFPLMTFDTVEAETPSWFAISRIVVFTAFSAFPLVLSFCRGHLGAPALIPETFSCFLFLSRKNAIPFLIRTPGARIFCDFC